MGTDQMDSYCTSVTNFEDNNSPPVSVNLKSSKLVLSTPVPCVPNDEGIYEWSRFFKLQFDPSCIEKEKSITVNLFKTKKSKSKCEKLGTSKSFFLCHFRHQEVKDMMLEFKDSYDSKCEGRVHLRMQYVLDEHQLFTDIFTRYQERIKLLMKCSETLDNQKAVHLAHQNKSMKQVKESLEEEQASHRAGFYSIVENDSFLYSYENTNDNKFLMRNFEERFSTKFRANNFMTGQLTLE